MITEDAGQGDFNHQRGARGHPLLSARAVDHWNRFGLKWQQRTMWNCQSFDVRWMSEYPGATGSCRYECGQCGTTQHPSLSSHCRVSTVHWSQYTLPELPTPRLTQIISSLLVYLELQTLQLKVKFKKSYGLIKEVILSESILWIENWIKMRVT